MVGPTPQHWANREELEMQYTTRINAMSISSLQRSIGRNLSLPLLTCPSMIGPHRLRFHIPIAARGRFIRTIRNPPAVTRFGQMRPDLGFWAPLPQQQHPPSPEEVSWHDSYRAACEQRQSRPGNFPGAALPSEWHRNARSIGRMLRGNPVRSSNRARQRSGRCRRSHEALAAVRYHRTGAVTT